MTLSPFDAAALGWYAANGRPLAFRRTSDPWAVLVSEVMAQQTQAARAAAAWTTFMERFPTPADLAATSTAEVIRAWRGLGYNRRAVALRAAAVRMVEEHDGRVPDTIEALEALPGIGPYTARAVLAIAFGRPVAPLDTNIRRVLARALPPADRARSRSARSFQVWADALVPPAGAAAWTHALMDIGAAFCRKASPRCDSCPVAAHCAFAASGLAASGVPDEGAMRPALRRSPPPAFESTNRWLRGRILDVLRDAPPAAWVPFDGPMGGHPVGAVRDAVEALEREGFLERAGRDQALARLAAG